MQPQKGYDPQVDNYSPTELGHLYSSSNVSMCCTTTASNLKHSALEGSSLRLWKFVGVLYRWFRS